MRKIINFRCERCKEEFDCKVGNVEFDIIDDGKDVKPVFQNPITCPNCGVLKKGQYTLTEIGQTDLTAIFMAVDDQQLWK